MSNIESWFDIESEREYSGVSSFCLQGGRVSTCVRSEGAATRLRGPCESTGGIFQEYVNVEKRVRKRSTEYDDEGDEQRGSRTTTWNEL